METDLFGNPITRPIFGDTMKPKKRSNPIPKGYAAYPGGGIKGETCRTCKFKFKNEMRSGKVFWKCELARYKWTSGGGSDIQMRSPACNQWQPLEIPGYCKARKCSPTCYHFTIGKCPDELRKAVKMAVSPG